MSSFLFEYEVHQHSKLCSSSNFKVFNQIKSIEQNMNLTVLLHYVQLLTYYGYRQVESCTLAQLERKTDEKILYNT